MKSDIMKTMNTRHCIQSMPMKDTADASQCRMHNNDGN